MSEIRISMDITVRAAVPIVVITAFAIVTVPVVIIRRIMIAIALLVTVPVVVYGAAVVAGRPASKIAVTKGVVICRLFI